MKTLNRLVVLPALMVSTAAFPQTTFPDPSQCRQVQQQYFDRCVSERWFGSIGYMELTERCRGVARDEYERCLGVI